MNISLFSFSFKFFFSNSPKGRTHTSRNHPHITSKSNQTPEEEKKNDVANPHFPNNDRGTPVGTALKVGGKWDAYFTAPQADAAAKHDGAAILILPDVIGIWQNSQLIADQFAANGYATLIIDLFNGDPIPLNRPGDFDFMKWMTGGSTGDNPHTPAAVDPIAEAAIKYLKEEKGVKKLGAVGYCFGAKVRGGGLPPLLLSLSL